MSKVIHFVNKQRIVEQASEWLARLERGLDDTERKQIGEWLEQDVKHGNALLELSLLWDDMSVLEELREVFPAPPRPVAQELPHRYKIPFAVSIAASVACLTLVFLLILTPLSFSTTDGFSWSKSPADAIEPAAIYATAIGEYRDIALPDGSIATLNTDSRIRVAFERDARVLVLEKGEAFFKVAKNSDRPFVVHAGGHRVQAVGTAFNVNFSDSSGLEVTVTEGRVRLTSRRSATRRNASESENETFLNGGQQALIAETEDVRLREVSSQEIQKGLAWRQGYVIFDRKPLYQVIAEFGRYTPNRIVIVDQTLREVSVAGYLKSDDIDGLLLMLRENFRINSSRNDAGDIILTSL